MIFILFFLQQDVERLASDDPQVRQQATQALIAAGPKIVPEVAKLLDSKDPELASRAEAIIRAIGLAALPALGESPFAKSIVLDKARELLDTTSSTVELKEPPDWPADAALELGSGGGHGGRLRWTRARPGNQGVDVVSIEFNDNTRSYESKWPPDRGIVTLRRAKMSPDDYRTLLRVLSAVNAAQISRVRSNRGWGSSGNFWAHVRVEQDRPLMDEQHCGYPSSFNEFRYLKARKAEDFAGKRLAELAYEKYEFTAADRAWASAKFLRDYPRFKDDKGYWWVRERYLQIIGVLGDASALPLLREIIAGPPTERSTYHAINAITRLIGKDVRGDKIEEMDVEAVRARLEAELKR